MDPGLTVSAVASIPFSSGMEDLTNVLLTNADMEYTAANALNKQGVTSRGYPRGWRNTGTLSGNSWGVNNDAKHIYGISCFWASASPLPNTFELYQTIPASKIEPGTYLVTCNLGVFKEKLGTCRLFANKSVQYYGKESDYLPSVLTSGETNTFAGYGGSGSGKMTLNPMQVIVTVKEGESLKLGIRTSNHKADGTRSTNDNHGWFKVDHFRIQKVNAVDDETGIPSVQKQIVRNQDNRFYDLSGRLANSQIKKGVYVVDGRKVVM